MSNVELNILRRSIEAASPELVTKQNVLAVIDKMLAEITAQYERWEQEDREETEESPSCDCGSCSDCTMWEYNQRMKPDNQGIVSIETTVGETLTFGQ